MKKWKIILIVLAIVLALFLIVNFVLSSSTGLSKGQSVSNFTLLDETGKNISLMEYQEQTVLLIFSTPDCFGCTQMYPGISSYQYTSDSVQILMLRDDTRESNLELKKEYNWNFPVLTATDEILNTFSVNSFPFMIVLEKNIVKNKGFAFTVEEFQALISKN